MARTHARKLVPAACLGLLVAATAASAGCYRRVVGASGIGADQYQVSEPYQESSRIDRWLFGDDATSDRSRTGSRLPSHR